MKTLLLSLILVVSVTAGAQTYTFTTAGVSGQNGPTQTDVDNAYTATTLDGAVTINTQGIQEWTVPFTATYQIQAVGASGGNSTWSGTVLGGNGADMTGEFTLTAGQVISIMVGQVGESDAVGGGGGGTFVATAGTPLIVAGGGGGASSDQPGVDAVDTQDGTYCSMNVIAGGTNGNGGDACTTSDNNGGGGGGFYTDGVTPNTGGSNNNGFGGQSFLNGGVGGQPGRMDGACSQDAWGGFGGGGSTTCNTVGGGGGGGYSGGAGGQHYGNCGGGSIRAGGGGGGSFNSGSNTVNLAGMNTGDGFVIITVLCDAINVTPVADTICQYSPVTLDASSNNGGTITWDNGVMNGVAFYPDTTGWVTYTATSDTSADCGQSVDIYVKEAPDFTLSATDELYANDGTISLYLNNGIFPFTYDWDNDGTGDFDDTPNLTGLTAGTYTVEVMHGNGCSTTQSIIVGSQVSLDEISLSQLNIYPNPSADGNFTVSVSGVLESVEVFDVLGRAVSVKIDIAKGLIEGSNLDNGKYMVRVKSSEGIFVKEIIIQK